MASLVKDCVEHGGRLTRSYTTAHLRRAFKRMAVPVRDETRCPIGIASQANARPGGPKLTPRAVAGTRRPDLDTAGTLTRLVPAFAVFQRPAETADALPASVIGWADASNRDTKTGLRLEVDQARAIGPDGAGMYALPGAGELCAALDIPGEGVAGTCAPVGDPDRFAPTAITLVPRGVAIWGPVASDHHAVRLLTHDGRWRTATVANNGAYDVLSKVPRLITYRDGHGITHYADWTMTLCLPGQPCPRRPGTSDDAQRHRWPTH
ncbi:MAG TPA: hypothetical protein VNS09_03505 [Solirubrobacter sp.]|nr:hypothetical protein [Solirubrobacter sp.]